MVTTTFSKDSLGLHIVDEYGTFTNVPLFGGMGTFGIQYGVRFDVNTLTVVQPNPDIFLFNETVAFTDYDTNERWYFFPTGPDANFPGLIVGEWNLRSNRVDIQDSIVAQSYGTLYTYESEYWAMWHKYKTFYTPTFTMSPGWIKKIRRQPPPTVIPPVVVVEPPTIITPPTIIEPPVIITPPAVEVSLGKVYNKINIEDILPKQTLKTTYGIWLDSNLQQTGNLLTYHTCSNQTFTSSNKTIFQSKCDTCPATPMFDISYGHVDGSGSRDLGGLDYFTLSKAVYGQYRNMCFGNIDKIKIGNKTVNHFYVINVKTDRMGDRLDEGLNEINLHHLSGSQFGIVNAHTGSNVKLGTPGNILRLIDDSRLNTNTVTDTYFYNSIDRKSYGGEYYYMVSGSLEQGIYNSTQPAVYGLSFPRLGVILLDADMLDMSASFLTTTGSDMYGDNSMKLFTSLSGSALYTDLSGDYLGFKARKVKYEHVEKYFIRIKNQDFNFSNNPTWVSGSDNIIIDGFNAGNPQTYISQIGMYDDNHELIAVGKINKPIKKSFTSEGLFSVTVKY